jgi:hypothetical protein
VSPICGRAALRSSPSYRTTFVQPSTWGGVIETLGADGFPGLRRAKPDQRRLSGGLSGVACPPSTPKRPWSPPLSLAQDTHANFGIRDQEGLFQIGQSFAPLDCYNNAARTTNTAAGVMSHEGSWMANAALFDRFFLSGAAPVIRRGADVTEVKSLENVLDDFAAGQGKLANPRTWLFAQRDEETVRRMLRNHRQIAGTILSEGTFNVNSTSVPAWAALLASAKRNALGAANETEPAATTNARFPRSVRVDAAEVSSGNSLTEPRSWTGRRR